MLFDSIEYLLFLPIVFCLYWVSPHTLQNRLLLLASYFFYGQWDIKFLFLIVLSTCVDFLTGILIADGRVTKRDLLKSSSWLFLSAIIYLVISWPTTDNGLSGLALNNDAIIISIILFITWISAIFIAKKVIPKLSQQTNKRLFVTISIVVNLTILAFFKYFNFFIDSAEQLIQSFGGDAALFHLNIILPVGISFYTFQTISYSIDIYRGKTNATHKFLDFALFVSYFPQLVAGPIERASNLMPRIIQKRQINLEQIKRGLTLIAWGLFKKVAIADGLAGSVNSIYNTTGNVSAPDIVLATFFFAFQIYCDFSAYSDIARGTSKLLGIELMRNFNLPYFAKDPSEFWRRWHISLSSWLKDYVYIPLGGNKKGTFITYRNLMLTMLLGGLWHGAAWNYILWGAYQGIILSIHRIFSSDAKVEQSSINSTLKIVLFFSITCYGWLLFRANSFEQISTFSSSLIYGWDDLSLSMKRPTLAAFLGLPILIMYECCEYKMQNIRFYKAIPTPFLALLLAIIFLIIFMGMSHPPAQFIYFQF